MFFRFCETKFDLIGACSYLGTLPVQGSKIALVRSYLQVPQAAGQVKILIFLMKIKYFPIYTNNFCDAGQVLILRYFETCCIKQAPKG